MSEFCVTAVVTLYMCSVSRWGLWRPVPVGDAGRRSASWWHAGRRERARTQSGLAGQSACAHTHAAQCGRRQVAGRKVHFGWLACSCRAVSRNGAGAPTVRTHTSASQGQPTKQTVSHIYIHTMQAIGVLGGARTSLARSSAFRTCEAVQAMATAAQTPRAWACEVPALCLHISWCRRTA